jgi:hypothetical protein
LLSLLASFSGLALPASASEATPLVSALRKLNESPNEQNLAEVLRVWQVLQAEGRARVRERRWVLQALLETGRFEQAQAFALSFEASPLPQWPRLVPLASTAARRLWVLTADAERLVEEGWEADLRPQLWVQAAVGCGFCRRAAQALSNDELLGPLMRKHSHWLASGSDLLEAAQWRSDFQDFPLKLVTDRRGWPFEGAWTTPQFYFVRQGKVVRTESGWPRDGSQRAALLDGFKDLGLA